MWPSSLMEAYSSAKALEGSIEETRSGVCFESKKLPNYVAKVAAPKGQNLFDEMPTSENKEYSFEKVEIQKEIGNIMNFEMDPCVIDTKHEFAFRQKTVGAFNDEVKTDLMKEKECISHKNLEDQSILQGFIHDRGKEIWVLSGEENEEIEVMEFKEEFDNDKGLTMFDKMLETGERPDVMWRNLLIDGLMKFWMDFELHRVMVLNRRYSVLGRLSDVQKVFDKAKSVHCYWIRHNYGDNVFAETSMVDLYLKFGCLRARWFSKVGGVIRQSGRAHVLYPK